MDVESKPPRMPCQTFMGYDRERTGTMIHFRNPDTNKVTDLEAGVLLDGHMGWHNQYRLVRFARELGLPLSVEDAGVLAAAEAYGDDFRADEPDWEALGWIEEQASDWIEDNLLNGVLVHDMGEVSLYEVGPCPECGELRFVDEDMVFGFTQECAGGPNFDHLQTY